jgi:hypothetical protein
MHGLKLLKQMIIREHLIYFRELLMLLSDLMEKNLQSLLIEITTICHIWSLYLTRMVL